MLRHHVEAARRRGGRSPTSRAPQSRAALSTMARSTGWRSVGELAITRRISAVAVCCSSASVSSRLRASELREQPHVLDRDHRLVGEGLEQLDLLVARTARPRPRRRRSTPIGAPSRSIGHAEDASEARRARSVSGRAVLRIRLDVGDVNDRAVEDRPARDGAPARVASGTLRRTASTPSAVKLWCATRWSSSPSNRKTAPHEPRRTAARRSATIASNTGWTSVGELRSPAGSRSSPSAAPAPRSPARGLRERGSSPAAP